MKNSKNMSKTSNKMVSKQAEVSEIDTDQLVYEGVLSVLSSKKSSWNGTMTELSSKLSKSMKKNSVYLPKSPSSLRVVLNRIAKQLRTQKVDITFERATDYNRTRLVTISK